MKLWMPCSDYNASQGGVPNLSSDVLLEIMIFIASFSQSCYNRLVHGSSIILVQQKTVIDDHKLIIE